MPTVEELKNIYNLFRVSQQTKELSGGRCYWKDDIVIGYEIVYKSND